MKKHNLAFIDLETTGFDPDKHEIIEIGCIVAKQIPRPGLPAGPTRGQGKGPGLEMLQEFDLKVKPEHLETADPEALQINGYSSADWLFAVSLEQALKTVAEKCADSILVAVNITFEWSFLEKAFKQSGMKYPFHYHKLDLIPMMFAKYYDDERVQGFSLRSLTEFFGIKNERAHTALADIRATFEVYKKLLGI